MNTKWISYTDIEDRFLKYYVALFSEFDSTESIANAHTEFKILQLENGLCLPVTINNSIVLKNTYVCSPFTTYALYSIHEIQQKIQNKILQFPLFGIIQSISICLKIAKIDKHIHVNNYLLSTNPIPNYLVDQIPAFTQFLKQDFQDHAILFKSLNEIEHQDIINKFEAAGYRKIAIRNVYLLDIDYTNWYKHKNNKIDKSIIKKQQLVYKSHAEMENYLEAAVELYSKLYLIKYSEYNPQYTLHYFKYCYERELIHFQGYTDLKGILKAFSGVLQTQGTIISPFVGYDTSASQNEAYYIHAIQTLTQYSFETNRMINLSSGAASFKRLRGAKASMEYTLVYTKHLPIYRRIMWRIIEFISNTIGLQLMQKYKL